MASKLDHPRLIICEGGSDAGFFRALVADRAAIKPFRVMVATEINAAGKRLAGGIDGFGRVLDTITTFDDFAQLEHIVLVADSDRDVRGNFQNVCAQIAATAPFGTPPVNRYTAPAAPLAWSTGGRPLITVLFVPWTDKDGHLECLLLPAAMAAANPAAACIDAFCTCAGTDAWPEAHLLAEMKLRCLIAAGYKADPFLSVRFLWDNAPDLVPIDHACFNQISDFLAAVP